MQPRVALRFPGIERAIRRNHGYRLTVPHSTFQRRFDIMPGKKVGSLGAHDLVEQYLWSLVERRRRIYESYQKNKNDALALRYLLEVEAAGLRLETGVNIRTKCPGLGLNVSELPFQSLSII
jgi:hypothetical protein